MRVRARGRGPAPGSRMMIEPPLPEMLPDTLAARPLGSTQAIFARLEGCGLDRIAAGNLTARLSGLEPTRRGWTVEEIDRLLFLGWLAAHDRLPR